MQPSISPTTTRQHEWAACCYYDKSTIDKGQEKRQLELQWLTLGSLSFNHSFTCSALVESQKRRLSFSDISFSEPRARDSFRFPYTENTRAKTIHKIHKSPRARGKRKMWLLLYKIYILLHWSTNTHAYKDSKFTNLLFYYLSGEREDQIKRVLEREGVSVCLFDDQSSNNKKELKAPPWDLDDPIASLYKQTLNPNR